MENCIVSHLIFILIIFITLSKSWFNYLLISLFLFIYFQSNNFSDNNRYSYMMPASVLTFSDEHLTFVYRHPFPFLLKIASRFHFAWFRWVDLWYRLAFSRYSISPNMVISQGWARLTQEICSLSWWNFLEGDDLLLWWLAIRIVMKTWKVLMKMKQTQKKAKASYGKRGWIMTTLSPLDSAVPEMHSYSFQLYEPL